MDCTSFYSVKGGSFSGLTLAHAHRTSYIEAHPDHSGWDYDKEKP